ncbi:MAG TPA: serine/threonine-protein kinase [Gemmataceae bacterium]|jgi:serine/threonine-protein kinase|nr:serine/threonine-protein kinase [Gemmataceae bacterium]
MHVGLTIGPFTLEKELGSGAMGIVYRARFHEDGKPERTVALKVIAFGLTANEHAMARFEREYKILKQLKHPNIVRHFATGRYKGTPFFAMEYVAGRSLDRVMADRSTGAINKPLFTWEEVIEMGKPLCSALQHAHDKGIIHRDLKPSNLMLTDEGILKLTDFGIAKDVDVTAITGANNTIGTAAYMSPEQCKGEKNLTGKSDIYSLGVVFYELLTGRKPFLAESSVDMFLMHVQSTFPRPATLNPDIPVWLDTLVCQMMEKRPELRPRDAAMVGQVLDEIMEKVAANVSAGADVAGSRNLDPRKLGDDDKHAARAIRAGSRKRKLKKRRRPIYNRGWFVILACVALLGTIGAIIYFGAIAPPSADSLLKKIDAAKEPDKQQQLAAEYLKYYKDRDDDATKRVKALDRSLKVAERERILLNRYKNERLRAHGEEGDDPDAYAKTMTALSAENDGDLAAARNNWNDLADKFAKDINDARALWGWVAQKKLNDLSTKEAALAELAQQLEREFRAEDKDPRFDDFQMRVVNAMRLEQLGDNALAYERWNQIAETLKGDGERRGEYVIVRSRVRALEGNRKPGDVAGRVELIDKAITQAKALLALDVVAQKKKGRNLLRDIRDVYQGETGVVGKKVAEAKALLAQYPPQT